MTWDTFTKTIKESELESGTQAQILIKLFKRAGYINKKEDYISESTAKKWIDGTRKCKVSAYFPDEEYVQKQELYKFFRRRPQDKLEKLQKIFYEEIDNNSPIDCMTKDMNVFCWSLVNQFLDILKFQRVDMPDSDISTSDVLSNFEMISDTVENEISRNEAIEQNSIIPLSEKVCHNETKSKATGAQIAIPQYCKVCFCCKNWKCDAEVTYKDIDDEYGECKAFGKSVLASDGVGCDKFKENYNKIMHYQFYRENKCLFNMLPDIK